MQYIKGCTANEDIKCSEQIKIPIYFKGSGYRPAKICVKIAKCSLNTTVEIKGEK